MISFVSAGGVCISAFCPCIYPLFNISWWTNKKSELYTIIYKKTLGLESHLLESRICTALLKYQYMCLQVKMNQTKQNNSVAAMTAENETLVHNGRVKSLLHWSQQQPLHWIQPQTYRITLVTIRDLIIKINVLSTKVEQWRMWKLQIVPNLITFESQEVSACFVKPAVTRLKLGKLTTAHRRFGPLTGYWHGTEATCWDCGTQFAVFPCWTPPNALFLLQHDPTFLWTSLPLPADQQGRSCPAGIG